MSKNRNKCVITKNRGLKQRINSFETSIFIFLNPNCRDSYFKGKTAWTNQKKYPVPISIRKLKFVLGIDKNT